MSTTIEKLRPQKDIGSKELHGTGMPSIYVSAILYSSLQFMTPQRLIQAQCIVSMPHQHFSGTNLAYPILSLLFYIILLNFLLLNKIRKRKMLERKVSNDSLLNSKII